MVANTSDAGAVFAERSAARGRTSIWPRSAEASLAVLVTVVLVVARMIEARGYTQAHWVTVTGYALTICCGLVLVARRRAPWAVFFATLSIAIAATAIDHASGLIALPVLVAVYTLAQLTDLRAAVTVSVTAGIALALVRGFLQPSGWSDARTAAEPALVLAALFLGWAVSVHRAYIAEINERADRAERTREEEARRQVEAERLRIARELHDVVAHNIAMINLQAGAAAHVLGERPDAAAQALETIRTASRATLGELRSILGVLRAVDEEDLRAPAPGLDQLDALIAATSSAGLPTRLIISGSRRALPASTDLAAYRIVQESLTNTLRHAGRAVAVVSISFERDRLSVDVDDTGDVGGLAAQPSAVEGHGIIGMRERATALGGQFEAGPRPGGGFRVHAALPVAAQP